MASAFIPGSAAVACNLAALCRALGFTDILAGAGLIVRSCPRGGAACVEENLSGVLGKGAHSSEGNYEQPPHFSYLGGGTQARSADLNEHPLAS